jgi:hypothetical protein
VVPSSWQTTDESVLAPPDGVRSLSVAN